MQKTLKIAFFLSLFALIVFHSCTPDDKTPPVVEIELPSDGAFVDAGDTVLIKATATDDEQITRWVITMTDNAFIPIGPRIEFEPSGKIVQIETEYPIPIDLASGTYYIRVSASDGEATTNAFSQLNLTGIPKDRLGLVAIVESNGNYSAKYRMDGQAWQTIADLGNEFVGAELSSEAQRLVTSGWETEPFRVFDLNTMLEVYLRDCQSAPGEPCVSAVATDGEYFFMGMREGRARSWSASGQLDSDFTTPEFRYPRDFHFQDNRIYTVERSFADNFQRWASYNADNGFPLQEIMINGSYVDAFPVTTNQTLMISNENGLGQMRYYFYVENGFQLPIPGPTGTIQAAAQHTPEKYFYAQSDGIYSIDLSSTNNLLFKGGISAEHLAYDGVTNELVAAYGNVIIGYDANDGGQRYLTSPGGEVQAVFVWFTR